MLTARRPRRRRGAISETLEHRRLLSTVVVNTLADETIVNSTTSLREAITAAKAGDTIQFKAGLSGQIKLTDGALTIGKSISLAGPGSGVLAVSGNNASRVFVVNAGAKASISGLKITGGRDVRGGAIFNAGTLTLDRVTLTGNTARGPDGDFADGGDGSGGALYNSGALTIMRSQITSNTARGGDGELGMTEGNAGNASGGAIYNDVKGKLTISTSTISGNTAAGGTAQGSPGGSGGGDGGFAQGGAILNLGSATLLTCTVQSNFARGSAGGGGDEAGGGGGYAKGGAIDSPGAISLTGCNFLSNAAIGGAGGEMFSFGLFNAGGNATGGAIVNGAALTIASSNFAGNYALGGNVQNVQGGAIASFGTIKMSTTTVAGNTAKADQNGADNLGDAGASAAGGGLWVAGTGGMITACTIANNQVFGGAGGHGYDLHGSETPSAPGGGAQGGGIGAASTLTLSDCTIANNAVVGGRGGDADFVTQSPAGDGGDASGGGIYFPGFFGSSLRLTACTVAGNRATGGVGGASSQTIPGEPPLSAGATGAAHGGGAFFAPRATVANSILATNTSASGPDAFGAVLSLGFNLIGKTDGSTGWSASTDLRGTNAKPLNPKLGALANNGGPTKTMALLAGSLAIDKGKSFGLTTDQRGRPRIVDLPGIANVPGQGGTDIGAFEVQATASSIVPFFVLKRPDGQ